MKRKIDSLTSMRFWMMVIVVISHFEYLGISEIYVKYFHGKHTLITLTYFFVLSGFGLAYSDKDLGKVTLKNSVGFAIGRMKKIWPIYVAGLVTCIPYCFYWYAERGVNLLSVVPTIFCKFLVCLPFMQSATGLEAFSRGINSSSWFLSTLFMLYICAPMILKINKRIKHSVKKDLVLLSANILLMALTHMAFTLLESRTFFDDFSHSSPYVRIYAFIAGVLIADLVKQWKWKNKLCIHIYELIIIIAGILWFIEFEMFFRNATIRSAMELILICMLIHACTLEGGFFDKILSTKWNIRLGELTMYIYMVHYPVRLNLDVLWRNVFPRTLLGGIIESCVVIVITIAIIAWILKMEKRRAERKILKN